MNDNKLKTIKNICSTFEKLNIDAIGIKLLNINSEKIKQLNIKKSTKKLRHCQFIDYVRKNKNVIYSTVDEQACIGGASALGFLRLPENIQSGMFYYNNLKQFENINAAKKTIDSISFLDANSFNCIIYFYLNENNINKLDVEMIDPDVLLLFLNPKKTMLLTQCYVYKYGGFINSKFSGRQSFCSDAVARVIKNQSPNITVGCGGSRKYTDIKDDELLLSIPWNDIEVLNEGLIHLLK